MPTLSAGERPIHHYRGGRLRPAPSLAASPAEARARAEPPVAAPDQNTGHVDAVPRDDLAGFEIAAAAISRASDVLRRPEGAPRSSPVQGRQADAPRAVPPIQAPAARTAPSPPGTGFLRRLADGRPAPQGLPRAPTDRRDPAPSRMAYKMERLWLTPLFRRFMRYGLPVLVVAGLAGGYLASEPRRDRITATFASLKTQIENRPEFMVTHMAIDGASAPVDSAIRQLATVPLPASSFQLDLDAMLARIESIDAVERVRIKVKAGGILSVEVTERRPAILWRDGNRLEMLDATGHRVATLLDRSKRPDLPVIAGAGAQARVPEALAILVAAQPVLPRIRGLVRMGDRRWDILLDRDQVVMLPEAGAVEAVERIMAIDAAEDLLARDVAVVDLRNSDRPTVRMSAAAMAATRTMTEELTEVSGQ